MLGAVLTVAVLFAQAAPESAPATPSSAAAPAPGKDLSGVTVTAAKKQRGDVDPNEVVCHSELPIGSRFPVKVCASHQALAERRQVDQMEVRRWTALRPGSGN